MVSPWMRHGIILEHISEIGGANVDRYVRLSLKRQFIFIQWEKLFEIAQGLNYLHSRNIVHGDLKGVSSYLRYIFLSLLSTLIRQTFSLTTNGTFG